MTVYHVLKCAEYKDSLLIFHIILIIIWYKKINEIIVLVETHGSNSLQEAMQMGTFQFRKRYEYSPQSSK